MSTVIRTRARRGVAASVLLLLAGCNEPNVPISFVVEVGAAPSVVTGERQTGANAGNVLCRYVVNARIEGDEGRTAEWLNSRTTLQYAAIHSDTLESTAEETAYFWGGPTLSKGIVQSRPWGWNGPESLTPVLQQTTHFYQVQGKPGPDSVAYTFVCQ